MSGKAEKKIRKLFTKEMKKEAREFAEARMKAEMNMFKPKPRWVPMFVWLWGLGIFVKIKKER